MSLQNSFTALWHEFNKPVEVWSVQDYFLLLRYVSKETIWVYQRRSSRHHVAGGRLLEHRTHQLQTGPRFLGGPDDTLPHRTEPHSDRWGWWRHPTSLLWVVFMETQHHKVGVLCLLSHSCGHSYCVLQRYRLFKGYNIMYDVPIFCFYFLNNLLSDTCAHTHISVITSVLHN